MVRLVVSVVILLFTAGFVLPLRAESCTEINAVEVISIAEQKAYGFTVEKVAGEKGSCLRHELNSSIILGVAGLESGTITCEAGFFLSDFSLKEGWVIIRSPTFSGVNVRYVQEPAYDTSKPGFKVAFDVEPGNPVALQLKTISLEGPDCEQWQEAF